MERTMDFNVYDKISKGEYIARGDMLYTKEEIEKMLSESGLNSLDMQLLCDLNVNDALTEITEIAGEDFLALQPYEHLNLPDDGWTVKKFFTLERKTGFLYILAAWQFLLFGLAGAVLKIRGAAGFIDFVLPMLFLLISYVGTALVVTILEPMWSKEAIEDAAVPEDAMRSQAKEILKRRQNILNSVCNTFHMYECMQQAIEDEDDNSKTTLRICHPEDSAIDDLK
ncbi:hypothetical protein IKG07_01300 [Candidatus Saccharibacteria bacterium]|nr:hypothetical protein [Candidatus Saccharibacteria bacterium]